MRVENYQVMPTKTNEDACFQTSSFFILSTLPSALRASGEFLNCGSQYTASGNSRVVGQHTATGSDFRFV
jgi:hypothetical protein